MRIAARVCRSAVIWTAILAVAEPRALAAQEDLEQLVELAVRVVDPEGRPVAGVEVGLTPAYDDKNGWAFARDALARTDGEGQASLRQSKRLFGALTLVARHADRGFIAFVNTPVDPTGELTVRMSPECRVG
jgi:hypothetical protein